MTIATKKAHRAASAGELYTPVKLPSGGIIRIR